MISNTEELARYIRATVPFPQAILQLKVNAAAGGVSFIWHGTEFFVKPTLYVFEVRGNSLFITVLSTLMQTVLTNADSSGRRFDTALEAVLEAEDLARVHQQPRAAAQMLASARQVLERMIGRTPTPARTE